MKFKTYLQSLSSKAYFRSLPRKIMGAGSLLFDRESRMLILKPTYREGWLLPGGVIEANESPRQACIREVKEETNLDCQPSRLLCVDYVNNSDRKIESVQFVFMSETIVQNTQIKLPEKEISSYQFLEPSAAIPLLNIHSRCRLASCLPYLDTQITVYLENGCNTNQ